MLGWITILCSPYPTISPSTSSSHFISHVHTFAPSSFKRFDKPQVPQIGSSVKGEVSSRIFDSKRIGSRRIEGYGFIMRGLNQHNTPSMFHSNSGRIFAEACPYIFLAKNKFSLNFDFPWLTHKKSISHFSILSSLYIRQPRVGLSNRLSTSVYCLHCFVVSTKWQKLSQSP